ncbi:hypothetical protein LTR86_011291 [Recurvomyces mirabilis]|nr:hypothetical protein LTR86_011291 [Recurvomyces mirabilis]
MAPPRLALAQSDSKARLFERLGLDENNNDNRRIYTMMKARQLRNDRNAIRAALIPALVNTGVKPPYSHAQFTETALHHEILEIYRLAKAETKPIYDLGHDMGDSEQDNWVIRWMLWHIFRYRDSRNRCRKSKTDSSGKSGGLDELSAASAASVPDVQRSFVFWDPVRNG